jgi:hypothetical protein
MNACFENVHTAFRGILTDDLHGRAFSFVILLRFGVLKNCSRNQL